jgi:magnesium transporter
MLSFVLYDPTEEQIIEGGRELLNRWRAEPATWLWLDVDGALDGELARELQTVFGLHPLALQDAARDRHPPKIEAFDGFTFLIYKGLSADSDDIDARTIQLALFVGERFLVTRHSARSLSVERLRARLAESPSLAGEGPAGAAVRLSRFIVDRYLRVLLEFEPRLEALEDQLLDGQGESVLTELAAHKSALTRLQRVFYYHTAVASHLHHTVHPGFNEDQVHAINDVREQQERVGSLAALYYQIASDLIEGYISVASHRLNQIMRVLTVVTVIFVPLSFLAGIYGMNFDVIPELRWRWGYYALVAVMATIVVTLLLTFRRKGWL